ncbi:MAG: hypothetical protein ORO03_00875 [Alphaproteobacteria bacterium]|nr:hypothetical protein [Alphaproteobacteria bacterium]
MADLNVEWMKPIQLPIDGKHSLTIDAESIPAKPGVYLFFRRMGTNTTEVVYVGKAENLKSRIHSHRNSHKLITELIDKKGVYYVMPGVFDALPGQVAKSSIKVIERVLIRACIEDEHPLINVQGVRLRTQHVASQLPAGAKFLEERIAFEPNKPAAKKAAAKKKVKKPKA